MVDAQPAIMLIARGLESQLPRKESTGEWTRIDLRDYEESLANCLESDLGKTIASAYELTKPSRTERFQIVNALRASEQRENKEWR